ncbi:hypothetical protein HZH66_014038 [Vespula vulgaris]|uniref:Uncharacterized protein n=1 Tax=Vespula vulgaris TaxID=7454 RepID=A0A834J756_VESVU|nr:hypothetical protein HZH66_014038 [Vespula vulgaris]
MSECRRSGYERNMTRKPYIINRIVYFIPNSIDNWHGIIQQLIESRIIEEDTSEFSSTVVLVIISRIVHELSMIK